MSFVKPTRVLCKRTLTIGDPYYTETQILRDNRMLVAGDWYDVVYNKNDGDNTFTIIDNQGHPHLHYMYSELDRKNYPSICKDYGPRDYAKWFYTPEELEKKRQRRLKHLRVKGDSLREKWAKLREEHGVYRKYTIEEFKRMIREKKNYS